MTLAVLDPRPFLEESAAGDRLLLASDLPAPDAPLCGAPCDGVTAREIAVAYAAIDHDGWELVGMTTCHLPPGHAVPFRRNGQMVTVHNGLRVSRHAPTGETTAVGYTWARTRPLGQIR